MNTKLNIRKHPTLMLPLLICLIGAATAGISIATLFNVAIDEDKSRLTHMVRSQASLMEAVAKFDAAHSRSAHPDGSFGATMEQIIAAHKSLNGFGETGEFVIGKLIDGQVAILQKPRYDGDINFQVPEFAPVPMQKALAGESGEIIAPDYLGNQVLASYQPVLLLNIGLVAKIDMAEVNQPFIISGIVAVILSAAMLVIGVFAVRFYSAPFAEKDAILTKLSKSQTALDKAQQLTGLGSWSWNVSDGSEEWSDEQFRIFGYQPGEVEPTMDLFVNAIHPDDRQRIGDEVADTLETDAPYDTQFRIIDTAGNTRHIRAHGEVERGDDGKPITMIGSVMDITARMITDDALRKSEERFTNSQRFANIGTWDWNIQTDELYWSDMIAPLFGYEAGKLETTYENFVGAIHPDDRDLVTGAVTACVETGAEYNVVHRVIWPDGTTRWLSEKGDVVRDETGQALNMLGVVQDITESRNMQQQLIQSSKMATLGEMATGVAHELNQPLNVIRMAINNIQRKVESDQADPDYLAAKLDKVEKQVERASAIIDHMRIFGRKPGVESQVLDPVKMVKGSLGLIGEQLRLSGIDIEIDTPETCRPIKGHQVHVEQVLLNLLSNARDVLRDIPGGDKRIKMSVHDSDNGIKICIEDNGGGIDPVDLPRLFEPFYTTKEVGQGTGLGLSISYGIITDMGGTIVAENFGDGARFTISVPAIVEECNAA